MRVCVVAPVSSDLDAAPAEVLAVANTFSAARWVVQIAEASRRGLREVLYAGRVDLVWLVGHAGSDGFELADGVWTPAEAGRWLAAIGARWLVANTCFSAEHVVMLQRVADVDVVGTVSPEGVTDAEAVETAIYLAGALVECGDLAEATRLASANGVLQYRFFPSGGKQRMAMGGREREEQAGEDLAALVTVFRGDPRTGQPGLVATLNALSLKIESLSLAIEQYQAVTNARLDALERAQKVGQQVQMSPRVASTLVASSLVLILLMFWLIVRLGGA